MKRSSLAKGLTWAGAIAGTSVMAITLTGGAAFAGGGPSAAATWSGKLKTGTAVAVTAKKFTGGDLFAVAECNPAVLTADASACDNTTAQTGSFTASGKLPKGTTLSWTVGTVGDGTCANKATCYIEVVDLTEYYGGDPTPASAVVAVKSGAKD